MVPHQDNLGKGRLRSIWTATHKPDVPEQLQQGEGGWAGAGQQHQQQHHPPQHSLHVAGQPQHQHQHQQLHQLHHSNSNHLSTHQLQQQHMQDTGYGAPLRGPLHIAAPSGYYHGGGGGGAAGDADAGGDDADTPKKQQGHHHGSGLSFLQPSTHVYGGRRRLPLGCGPLDRDILCNALACAGASMSDPLMSLVDSYYAGKLGTTSLAALGSNGALYSVLYFLCFTALAVLCTQAMAAANSRRDAAGCGRGFVQAMAATLVVAALLVVALLLLPEFLLGLFQTGPEVMALAKTYCMIRALSLPAALCMNVSQAAFRSLLDLTTPFCVVMTANAANFGLNHLLMVVLPYGMAGCGWASVISQYIGALLFAGLIYHRRHTFGIPQALAGAEDAYHAALAQKQQRARTPSKPGGGGSSSHTLAARKLAAGGGGGAHHHHTHSHQQSQPRQQQQQHGGRAPGGGVGSPSRQGGRHGGSRKSSRQGSREASPRGGGRGGGGIGGSPRRSRESSGTLRIDVGAFEQHLAASSSRGGADDAVAGGVLLAQDYVMVSGGAGGGSGSGPNSPARRRSSRLHSAGSSGDGGGGGGGVGGGASRISKTLSAAEAGGLPGIGAAAAAAAAPAAGNGEGIDEDDDFELHRWDSAGSGSKLPRYLVSGGGGAAGAAGSGSSSGGVARLVLLLRSLDWAGFAARFAGMMTRGMLILSTYTSANVVAARGGTAMMAAHQVVQQQQQLQMSFAWSFLHVGQSMTANLYHSTAPGGGPKAARLLSERIITWALLSCTSLAAATFTFRRALPSIFTQDDEVQALVATAALPAVLMLSMGWNNALEGCLLAADEQPYVVKVYPWAVVAALGLLATGAGSGAGLPGVWVALMTYYLVLLVGFAARYWVYRGNL